MKLRLKRMEGIERERYVHTHTDWREKEKWVSIVQLYSLICSPLLF